MLRDTAMRGHRLVFFCVCMALVRCGGSGTTGRTQAARLSEAGSTIIPATSDTIVDGGPGPADSSRGNVPFDGASAVAPVDADSDAIPADVPVDADNDGADGTFACGSETCLPSQFCFQPCTCGGAASSASAQTCEVDPKFRTTP